MTIQWPELEPNDLVLYQNNDGRPNRLVLTTKAGGLGYSMRVDSMLFDTRGAPPLTRSDLIDIVALIAVAIHSDGTEILHRMQIFKEEG